jgi:outer membrane usher protein FimD/PapC
MNFLQIRPVRPRRVTLAVMLALAANQSAASEPGQTLFNERFLDVGGGQHADLSIFAFGNRVTAGAYVPDVAVNGRNLGKQELRFVERSAGADAVPCLTPPMLSEWGVNTAVFPALQRDEPTLHKIQCVALIPDPLHAEWAPLKQRFFMKQINRNQLEQVSGGCFGSKNRPAQYTSNRSAPSYQPPVSSVSSRQPGWIGG